MKIALLGYGKMGRLIEKAALLKGHEITARISRQLGATQENQEKLEKADVAIDFSHPACVISNLEFCLKIEKPLIIGTTGWEEQLTLAKSMVERMKGSCLYAPNFSIGVYLFKQIVAYAATLFQPLKNYDVGGLEYHHKQKVDSPSGTAKNLEQTLLQNMPRVKDFKFSSIRCGHFPGTHTLYFDSSVDTVTLSHEARNREGFAQGAILAAEWILSKRGFFSIDDMMKDLERHD